MAPSDVSRRISSQPVCNSISDMCNFKRGIACYATLAPQMFQPGMVLNSDRKSYEFSFKAQRNQRETFSEQRTQDIHVSKQV